MGWFDDNHFAGEAHDFGMGYMYGHAASPRRSNAPRDAPASALDPATGYFKAGVRKCSVCLVYKTKADFSKDEAAKSAATRCCFECGVPLPADLSALTVAALKVIKTGLDAIRSSAKRYARSADSAHMRKNGIRTSEK